MQRSTRSGHEICSYEWLDEGRAGKLLSERAASRAALPMQTVKQSRRGRGENRGRLLPFVVASEALHVLQCKFPLL